jgi:anti-sigma regulatory factor (Ser/Thr protein kinase)
MEVKSFLSLSLYQAFSLTLGVWELEENIVVFGYKPTCFQAFVK